MLLLERRMVPSRTKAQALILAGQVFVKGEKITKVGTVVSVKDEILLKSGPKFVSRGGEKLEGALEDFNVSPDGMVCLDIGASTGGFTDCLLKHGAARVYAVDVGKGQLDLSLRNHPKVLNMEETHVQSLTKEQFIPEPRFVVVDASFISLKSVLPTVKKILSSGATVLPMVKPQFEVGPKFLKKGVVRSEEIQQKAVSDVITFAKELYFTYIGQTKARIKGPQGNQEYFLHLNT